MGEFFEPQLAGTDFDSEPPQDIRDGPQLDDIQYIFHPHSCLPPETCSLDKYLQCKLSRRQAPSADEKPWLPFQTRIDFEVAKFTQENLLNRVATDKLISLRRRFGANLGDFTIHNYTDMN